MTAPAFVRPPREAYARIVFGDPMGRAEFIAGVELRDGEHWGDLRAELVRAVTPLITAHTGGWDLMARAIERAIVDTWPDRAYFVEVGNDDDGWVQVFQPFGVPRNEPRWTAPDTCASCGAPAIYDTRTGERACSNPNRRCAR